MIKHYLHMAWRSLSRQRMFTLINLASMTIGFACCLAIAVFIHSELSFDKFHPSQAYIYRLGMDMKFGDQQNKGNTMGEPAGQDLMHDNSEIVQATRFTNNGITLLQAGDKAHRLEDVFFADSTFFELFDGFRLVEGNPHTALDNAGDLVLTASTAKLLFGDENPIGKQFRLDNEMAVRVTAVMADPPVNSHLQFRALVAWHSRVHSDMPGWLNNVNHITYVKLAPGVEAKTFFDKALTAALPKYVDPEIRKYTGTTLADFEKSGQYIRFFAEPISDIHLRSVTTRATGNQGAGAGDIRYVYIFSLVGLFILGIACFNFINLATARATERAREVGVRKVLGSHRAQLIGQFLTESVLLALGGVVLAVNLLYLFHPLLEQLVGRTLPLDLLYSWWMLPLLALFVLLLGVAAGLYPAWVLAGFMPVRVLKGGNVNTGRTRSWLRNSLVVLQFSLGTVLIISTLVVYDQLRYVQQKDMGFDKEQLVIVRDLWMIKGKTQTFKNEMAQLPGVANVSISNFTPLSGGNNNNALAPEGNLANTRVIHQASADEDLIPTLNANMRFGRSFRKGSVADSASMLINESCALSFGLKPEEAVGKRLTTLGDPSSPNPQNRPRLYTIIGVVKDFHFQSLREAISPVYFTLVGDGSNAVVRLNTSEVKNFITGAEAAWRRVGGQTALNYSFFDQRFEQLYQAEQRLGNIFTIFSGLAVFVASIGLFGLATFAASKRRKEMSVRKVLGASAWQISALFVRDFSKLVLLAFVLGAPAAWYFMDSWLQGFAYRVQLQPLTFVLAAVIAFGIALVAVSWQSIRAALSNPVDALKSE